MYENFVIVYVSNRIFAGEAVSDSPKDRLIILERTIEIVELTQVKDGRLQRVYQYVVPTGVNQHDLVMGVYCDAVIYSSDLQEEKRRSFAHDFCEFQEQLRKANSPIIQ